MSFIGSVGEIQSKYIGACFDKSFELRFGGTRGAYGGNNFGFLSKHRLIEQSFGLSDIFYFQQGNVGKKCKCLEFSADIFRFFLRTFYQQQVIIAFPLRD